MDRYGSSNTHRKENGRTPRAVVIEILVEGMDDMAAAEYLYETNWGGQGMACLGKESTLSSTPTASWQKIRPPLRR